MKTRLAATSISLLAASFASVAQSQSVTARAGTTVYVELMENIHSAFNKQGEIVYMQVVDPLMADGRVAIPAGARVEAEVGNVEGTGMMGRSGDVSFHPVRVAAADGQWLPLDPTNFGDEGEGAGAGMIFAIGVFAKGRPGFVPRGTEYRVTIRRDTEVEADIIAGARELVSGDLTLSGRVDPVAEIKTKKTKPGKPIVLELDIPADIQSLVTTRPMDVQIVSFNGYVPERPVQSSAVELNQKSGALSATFDWWSVIRYAQPGDSELVVQTRLSDGRLAQAELMMSTTWSID